MLAIAVIGMPHPLSGDDTSWSRFRGPNGSGVDQHSKLPAEFGPAQNLKWKTPLLAGHSSPVVAANRILLTAADSGQLLTICLDSRTGAERWRRPSPRPRQEKLDPRNHPASPTPVLDDEAVYVFFPDFGLISYSLDGRLRWQLPLGPFTNIYGMGASPVVVDNLVVLVCDQSLDSFIVAVEKNTGKIAWKTPRPHATSGHCSPIIYRRQPQDAAQIIAAGSFFLSAYHAATGERIWWVRGLCFEMKSTPVIGGDTVYINGYGSPQNQPDQKVETDSFRDVLASSDANGDGQLSLSEMPNELARNFFPAVDLDQSDSLSQREWDYFRASLASENSMMAIRLVGAGDMTTSNLLWKYHKNIPQLPSPILYDQLLYMISDRGIVTCLDPSDGSVRARGRLDGAAGNIYASPVAADGKIFFTTTDGKIAVVKSGGGLEVSAVNDLAERCYATPAISNHCMYVRTEQALYCFGQ